MNKLASILILLISVTIFSCSNAEEKGRKKVLISTNMGDMVVELYDETPLHRDNFIKLANEGFYEGVLFHRVIKGFMIQAGDPNSVNAGPAKRLGSGGPGYTIEAEINKQFFHKKGALSAARQGDQVNPEKRSSGSQFYIVQGAPLTDGAMDTLLMKMNGRLKKSIFQQCISKEQTALNKLRSEGKQAEFNMKAAEIRETADSLFRAAPKKNIPEEHKQVYREIGGYPSLDDNYTVFGEVVEGLDIIDKIAAVETGKFDRPVENMLIKKVEVLK